MIDLDKMEQSVNLLMRMYPESTRATQTIGDVHELITRLRQAEKDAARYRWLRDESNYCGVIGPLAFLTDSNGSFCMNEYQCKISLVEDSLDSAIDEAMNASNN